MMTKRDMAQWLGVAAIANTVAASSAMAAPSGDATMEAIIVAYTETMAQRDPVTAGQHGDLKALAQWPDDSPEALADFAASLRALAAKLDGLVPAALSEDQQLNRDLLRDRIAVALVGLGFDEGRLPFTTGDGFFTTPDYAALGVVLRSEAQARAWVAKLNALPGYYHAQIINMRRGIASGFMRPRLVTQQALDNVRAHIAQPVESHSLLNPIKALPDNLPASLRADLLTAAVHAVRTGVRPAELRVGDFLETAYLPMAPEALGIGAVPNGGDYYRYLIRLYASVDMSAAEIHQMGLNERDRIRGEMDAVIGQTSFAGDFKAFLTYVRTDPSFFAENGEDYFEKVSATLIRVNGLLPLYFRNLPRLPLTVREVASELKSSSSGYNPGDLTQGVPGVVIVNTERVASNPLPGMPAWALHEGVPGHHLQIALAQENPNLPAFRRKDDINAFVEGWALYSEHLGKEMGMYRTPYEDFGRLSLEMWRACRLIVDTGIHAMGWSRDQAMATLRDNTGLSEDAIAREIDRYIGWPGQALGYKIGEIRIRGLRSAAETALGSNFDLRDFHDALIMEGPMPLNILTDKMNRWIARRNA